MALRLPCRSGPAHRDPRSPTRASAGRCTPTLPLKRLVGSGLRGSHIENPGELTLGAKHRWQYCSAPRDRKRSSYSFTMQYRSYPTWLLAFSWGIGVIGVTGVKGPSATRCLRRNTWEVLCIWG
jgi:hypothetical protein